MSDNNEEQDNTALETVSFPVRSDRLPGLILERCASMDAALATILGIQIEILAHLTGKDVDEETTHWIEMLEGHRRRIAEEMQNSLRMQPDEADD